MRQAISNILDVLNRPVDANEPARPQQNNNPPRVENARAIDIPPNQQEAQPLRPVSVASVGVQPQDL